MILSFEFVFAIELVSYAFGVVLSLFSLSLSITDYLLIVRSHSSILVRSLSRPSSSQFVALCLSLSRIRSVFRLSVSRQSIFCWYAASDLQWPRFDYVRFIVSYVIFSICSVLYVPSILPLLFLFLCSNYHCQIVFYFVASVFCVNKRLMCVRVNCCRMGKKRNKKKYKQNNFGVRRERKKKHNNEATISTMKNWLN